LDSNDEPLSSQKVLVREILQDKKAELSILGDEISRLSATLQALPNKQANLASEIYRYSCILSPIRQLPPEIIREIFLYFTPSVHPASDLLNRTPVKLPWKLGHICRLWRTISISLGQLWSV
ncbi:hypothetical protein DFH06DRAFT_945956, partial [Mycena polygramma]